MKCEYCGNNLGIEDAVCPYCGKENRFAKMHTKDMRKYNADYASTREEVISNSRRFNSMTVRITIIAVLIAMIAGLMLALSHSYDIRYSREEREVAAHAARYRSEVRSLMDDRDYLGVCYYLQYHRISYSDALPEFYMVYNASYSYYSLMEYMNMLLSEDSYLSDEEVIETIAGIVERIYDCSEPESDYEREKYYSVEENNEYIKALTEHTEVIVQGYFGLSDEELKEFRGLSKAKKQLMLEKRWEDVR